MSNTIIGSIISKQNLTGEINKAVEYLELKPITQEKTAIPTKETQEITYDKGYTGLSKVTVNSIPEEYIIPSGSLDITENGTKDVTNYAEVNVNIEGKEDLTEELNTYNTELTEQETTINDIVEALKGKASGGGTSSDTAGEVYSTNETKTNDTWIDGKPIYRKVFTTTLPSSIKEGTYSTTSIDVTSLNIETPTDISGLVKTSNGKEYWNINSYNNTGSANDSICCYLSGSGKTFAITTNASVYASATANIIFEYTKV